MHLVQVAQHADDLDRAARFYAGLLGATEVARFDPPGLLFFQLGHGFLVVDTTLFSLSFELVAQLLGIGLGFLADAL